MRPLIPDNERFSITNGFPIVQQLLLLGMILLLIFGTAYAPSLLTKPKERSESQAQTIIPDTTNTQNNKLILTPFNEVEIGATAAYVWDVREQRALYSKAPDEVLPLASITKLMTALVAYELIDEEAMVEIPLEAIRQEGISGFVDGERFSLATLSELTLISSSNDGAYALAAAAGSKLVDQEENRPAAFIEAMNIKAEELGLHKTTFFNPTGLDLSTTQSGSYSTARETTFLMEYLLKQYPEILSATQLSNSAVYNESGSYHNVENTNVIIEDIPNLVGSKTGYTDLAGGNLVVAYDAGLNRPVIVTVLGSTRSGRFDDVGTLIEAVQNSIKEGIEE